MKTKSLFLPFLLISLLTGCATPPQPTPPALDAGQAAVGYVSQHPFAPQYVAIDKGYFKNEGLDVTGLQHGKPTPVALSGRRAAAVLPLSPASRCCSGAERDCQWSITAAWYNNFPVVSWSFDSGEEGQQTGRSAGS
jgi:hypothetical protein